jgi:hypothetical protein
MSIGPSVQVCRFRRQADRTVHSAPLSVQKPIGLSSRMKIAQFHHLTRSPEKGIAWFAEGGCEGTRVKGQTAGNRGPNAGRQASTGRCDQGAATAMRGVDRAPSPARARHSPFPHLLDQAPTGLRSRRTETADRRGGRSRGRRLELEKRAWRTGPGYANAGRRSRPRCTRRVAGSADALTPKPSALTNASIVRLTASTSPSMRSNPRATAVSTSSVSR